MLNRLNELAFPRLRRVKQLNNDYCGPAVLQMLMSFLGEELAQEEIVKATGLTRKIRSHGMTVEEMALAIDRLTPDYQFWYKRHSIIADLSRLVNDSGYPVGVEWQGVFEYEDEDEEADDDPGHYSVVTKIDTYRNLIWLADPFKDYAGKDRHFTVLQFERRWWDINTVTDPVSKKTREIDDYHLMFIIAPRGVGFPEETQMLRGHGRLY